MSALPNLLARVFRSRAMHSQQQVAERAARVIDQVIFDLGVGRLVQGTFQLDGQLRPHFFSGMARQADGLQAHVPLAALAEAADFARDAACAEHGPPPASVDALVQGLLREFRAQSPRFRALPARTA